MLSTHRRVPLLIVLILVLCVVVRSRRIAGENVYEWAGTVCLVRCHGGYSDDSLKISEGALSASGTSRTSMHLGDGMTSTRASQVDAGVDLLTSVCSRMRSKQTVTKASKNMADR